MNIVWHGTFDLLFSSYSVQFSHRWTLVPTFNELDNSEFRLLHDSAKVRFLCQHCLNAWTSMKGRVMFWFKLNQTAQSGVVYFKLFGQKCGKCKPEKFEHAMWYPEEVEKVIANLHQRIGRLCYGLQQISVSETRRSGKPRTQHNSDLCQACSAGICRETPLRVD